MSPLGKEQAQKIGVGLLEEVKDEKYIMYSSDLLRAKNTALIVAEHLKTTPVFVEELRERNLGVAVGKSVQWLKYSMPGKNC